jgi:hypothetical protein
VADLECLPLFFSKKEIIMNDTFWITLPVVTWGKLFQRATQADRDASDFLRVLIEHGEIKQNECTVYNPGSQQEMMT